MAWLLFARYLFLAALVGVTALCVWAELTSEASRGRDTHGRHG
jgi:hypothetical protein